MASNTQKMSSRADNCGIHGDVTLEDLVLLLRNLENYVEVVVNKSMNCIMTPNKRHENVLPEWLQFPLDFHQKLNKFVEYRLIPSGEIEPVRAQNLLDVLTRLGDRLGVCAQKHVIYHQHQDLINKQPLDRPKFNRSSVERRIIEASRSIESDVSSSNARSKYTNDQIVVSHRMALKTSLQELSMELEGLKQVTTSIAEVVWHSDERIDQLDAGVSDVFGRNRTTSQIYRTIMSKRQKIIGTVGGAGLGAIIGSPMGVLGSIVGSVVGGLTGVGSAVVMDKLHEA